MKNLFKKNQIIITALAIMIAIAGYLNLTKDTVSEKQSELYEAYNESNLSENEDSNLLLDISEVDNQTNLNTYEVTSTGNGDLIALENAAEAADNDPEQTEQTEAAPGEAVLASTTLSSDFFSTTKLTREQTRSRNKAMLMELIADTSISEEQKSAAIEKIVDLAEIAEIENATELLLEAKGFEGAVVSMDDATVEVVVNASTITEQQVAQIEDIVMRKTGMDAQAIYISAVVIQD